MEHPPAETSPARLCVFTKLDLTRLPPTNGYAHIDENNTSKLRLCAYLYANELTKIAEETLVLYPGPSRPLASRIHYLLSVTGNRVCITYKNADKKRVFEVYEVDLDTHRFNLLKSCEVKVDDHGPTAIIAIKDRCFLGFQNRSGVVELAKDTLEIDIFHKFEGVHGKSIDAFGYNGGKTLFAVDDMKWPKYAYYYDISGKPKKKGGKITLPNGINEIYEECVKVHGEIAVRSTYSQQGGSGNKLYILNSIGSVSHSCVLRSRSKEGRLHPTYTSMGYLQDGVVLLVANDEHEKNIDGCLLYLPKKEINGDVKEVRKLEIGDRCQDVVTVKDKQSGHVLATKKGKSILVEVKWRKDQLEVARELIIDDKPFDRLYMEM